MTKHASLTIFQDQETSRQLIVQWKLAYSNNILEKHGIKKSVEMKNKAGKGVIVTRIFHCLRWIFIARLWFSEESELIPGDNGSSTAEQRSWGGWELIIIYVGNGKWYWHPWFCQLRRLSFHTITINRELELGGFNKNVEWKVVREARIITLRGG